MQEKSINENNSVKVLEEYYAECVYEPRGLGGLEGYQRGEVCKVQKMAKPKGKINEIYYRVYHKVYRNQPDTNSYETCGQITFSKCFKRKVEVVRIS